MAQSTDMYDDADVANQLFAFTYDIAAPTGLNFAVVLGDFDSDTEGELIAQANIGDAFWSQMATDSYPTSIAVTAGDFTFTLDVTWEQ